MRRLSIDAVDALRRATASSSAEMESDETGRLSAPRGASDEPRAGDAAELPLRRPTARVFSAMEPSEDVDAWRDPSPAEPMRIRGDAAPPGVGAGTGADP